MDGQHEQAEQARTRVPTGRPGGVLRPASAPASGSPDSTGQSEPSASVDSLTYEEARDALAEIVRTLEAGGLPLEASLLLWERGERLATECERWLAGARERLARAVQSQEVPPREGSRTRL